MAEGFHADLTRGGRPRVCHVTAGDQWAGAEVQLVTTLLGLAAAGEFEVSAIVLNEGRVADELRALGLRAHVADERAGLLRLVTDVGRVLRQQGVAIVHTHKRKENIIGGLAALAGGVPHVVRTVHGLEDTHLSYRDPDDRAGLPARVGRGVKNRAVNLADSLVSRLTTRALIAVSDDIARRVQRSHLRCPRTVTVHNGIEVDEVAPGADAAELKRQHGFDSDALIVGTAGRLVAVKALDVFIAAARLITAALPQTRFVVVGDGPLRDYLHRMAAETGMAEQIRFTGFRSDVLDLLSMMDVVVMTSSYEGIPIVVLEAMALGRPVVLTRTGGHVEILAGHGEAYLTAPGDAAGLARACVGLLSSPEERADAGAGNRRLVRERFSRTQMVEKLSAVYRDLLGARAASAVDRARVGAQQA